MSDARPASSRSSAHADYRRLLTAPALVWLLLLVLLAASVWSAFIPLGALNPTINLLIAAVMLLVLATFLMDLKNASPLLRMVAVAGLLWVSFLFALTFTDYLSRRPILPEQMAHGALRAPALHR